MFADEPQLRLTPRSAIRPITQPPPVIDGRAPSSAELASSMQRSRPSRGRRWGWLAGLVLVGLAVVGAMQSGGDDPGTVDTTDTAAGRSTTSEPPGSSTTAPSTTAEPSAAVAADARLEPPGIGPLQVGVPLGELRDRGVGLTADERTFDASGGTCFDAEVHGSPDLRARFRSPTPGTAMSDPAEGRLVAVDIDAKRPTNRTVGGTGVALATPQAQVLTAYAGNVIDLPHPYVPGGHLYVVPVGNGTGIAFGTDGQVVTSIAVGVQDVITQIDGCG